MHACMCVLRVSVNCNSHFYYIKSLDNNGILVLFLVDLKFLIIRSLIYGLAILYYFRALVTSEILHCILEFNDILLVWNFYELNLFLSSHVVIFDRLLEKKTISFCSSVKW